MCKGKQWLVYDVQPGDPRFGKLVRCTTCGNGQQQEYLAKLCGLRGDMLDWTFETTKRTTANEAAYDTAQQLAQQPRRLYTLLGGYGVGKSRLLACIVNAGRKAGWTSVYTTTANVLDYLRVAYGDNVNLGYDQRWELLCNAKILALDEFDRWNPTSWAREKFEQLLDTRYSDGMSKLTCFAANATVDALPGYVASRIQDQACYLFEMTGYDVRRLVR